MVQVHPGGQGTGVLPEADAAAQGQDGGRVGLISLTGLTGSCQPSTSLGSFLVAWPACRPKAETGNPKAETLRHAEPAVLAKSCRRLLLPCCMHRLKTKGGFSIALRDFGGPKGARVLLFLPANGFHGECYRPMVSALQC